MNSKIIFLDCDGTIFDAPRGMMSASKYTKYAIKELINNGHLVFIASGRCKCLLPKEVVDLNPSGFITTNGAFAYIGDKVIFDQPMKKEDVQEVIDYCKITDALYFLESQERIYCNDIHCDLYHEFIDGWGIDDSMFTNIIDDQNCYLMMTAFNNEKDCIAFDFNLNNKLDIRRQYGFTSFDVASKGADKGLAVNKVLEYLNISKDDAYAFGDGLNDLEMLLNVTNSYAMENGHEKLKSLASHIAPDVLQDGFYKMMCQEGLIKALDD